MRTLGEEHISSQKVAIIELVKNAYDADATRVQVRFHGPLEIGAGCIEVIDNGHGMSLETIQTTWMEPATIIKKRNTRSEERYRRVLGEKGIGRFATSRLANRLELVTRRADAERESRVCLDWRQFDDEKYLDEVEFFWESTEPNEICPGGTIEALWAKDKQKPNRRSLSHGTILRMTGLCQRWGKEQVEEIRRGLASLISPFPSVVGTSFAQELPDKFQIRLQFPKPYQRFSGLIGPSEVLRNPHYSLRGSVSENGSYQFTISLRELSEPFVISGQFTLPPNVGGGKGGARLQQCGPFHLELRVWDRDTFSIADLAHKYGSTITNFQRDLNDAVGIRLYRDGFRVWPYGEAGNDWLGLDARHAQNRPLRLTHNQIVGYVLISADKNPQLRDQSNREGLIEGAAVNDLHVLIKMALAELETRRYSDRLKSREFKGSGLFRSLNLATLSDLIKERHPDDTELYSLVSQQEKKVEQTQQVLSRYRRLATLGQLITTLVHDGEAPLVHIRNQAQLGERDIRRAGGENNQFVQRLGQRFEKIDRQVDVLADFFEKIEPFGRRRQRELVRVRLEEVIANTFALLKAEIARNSVDVCLPRTETWITIEPMEIQPIIINLLQNSLYWLSQVPENSRQIIVLVYSVAPEEVGILFSDSGPGVKPEVRAQIFDPYFSTKPDGMGLGLAIVGDIVNEYYGGSLELLDGGPLPGATFLITLRRSV
jgi:signal transduction histidine kinase